MTHDWILDVLEDLRSYARKNGLPRVAEAAAEALGVAREELSGTGESGTGETGAEETGAEETGTGDTGAGERAN